MKAIDDLIAKRYKLCVNTNLGNGSFGTIYKGEDVETKKEVAIKIESKKCECPQLKHEARIYKTIQGGGKINNKKYF